MRSHPLYKYKNQLVKIQSLISIIVNIFFLFLSFFIIFNPITIKKIFNSNNFFIFSEGGFGHQVWQLDFARYLKKEKPFFILLYNPTRHNKYLSCCYCFPYLNIPTCINLKYKFGEYEGGNTFLIKKFIIFILTKIFKKKNILINKEIYFQLKHDLIELGLDRKITKEVSKKKYLGHEYWQNYYYYSIFHKLLPRPNLPNKTLSKLKKKITKKLSNNKTCVLYLRYREAKSPDSLIRNAGAASDYYKLISYLNSKNYKIFLVGEAKEILGKHINKFNNIFDYKFFGIEKKLFEIYCAFNHDLMIAECGGYHNLGFYSDLAIGINFFPYGYIPPGFKDILYKKIYKNGIVTKNSENHQKYHEFRKQFSNKKLFNFYIKNSKYKVENNNKNEIYNFCKKIIENNDKNLSNKFDLLQSSKKK
jgi:hypothetical protein